MDRQRFPLRTSDRAIALWLLATCGGCAIPDYHMPHGFSSTYFRALQHQNAVSSAVDSVIMRPSPASAPAPVESPPIEPSPLYVPQNSEQSPAAWNRFRSSLSVSTTTLPPTPSPAPSTLP